ncbi:antitoxin VapB [Rhizobium sp. RU20A]|uniref:antitoxin n=1 Tax=Rhizobium sp. RU20A TaxID=1907412 RepID=UPI000957515C|nr:AbrB/MazE/SpoVT family DNA-binding domain-containing protein [Rhizobium sp. RU20A]SIQ39758.1 antitoxin VapB [Rhizobium sp. RU20A]
MGATKEREVSIFRNGRSRAVRIPSDFEIEGDSVMMSQDEKGIIHISPKEKKMSLLEVLDWLETQEPFEEEFPEIDDPLPEPVDL